MYDWKGGSTTVKNQTRDALQMVYDNLNKGQRDKLLKDEKIRELFDRYGVEVES